MFEKRDNKTFKNQSLGLLQTCKFEYKRLILLQMESQGRFCKDDQA